MDTLKTTPPQDPSLMGFTPLKTSPITPNQGKIGDKTVTSLPSPTVQTTTEKRSLLRCIATPFVFTAKKIAAFVMMILRGIGWLFGMRTNKQPEPIVTPPQPTPQGLTKPIPTITVTPPQSNKKPVVNAHVDHPEQNDQPTPQGLTKPIPTITVTPTQPDKEPIINAHVDHPEQNDQPTPQGLTKPIPTITVTPPQSDKKPVINAQVDHPEQNDQPTPQGLTKPIPIITITPPQPQPNREPTVNHQPDEQNELEKVIADAIENDIFKADAIAQRLIKPIPIITITPPQSNREPTVNHQLDEQNELEKIITDAIENDISEADAKDLELEKGWESIDTSSQIPINRERLHLQEKHCDIISYFFDYLTDPKISDDSLVGFQNGKIIALENPSESDKQNAKEIFIHLLEETYGTRLGDRINHRYKLNNSKDLTLKDLTLNDVKKALIGVAANVRKDDLVRLFHAIKSDGLEPLPSGSAERNKGKEPVSSGSTERKQGEEPFRCMDFLKQFYPENFESLKKVDSFDSLSPEQIGLLLSAFRTLPTGKDDTTGSTLEVLFPGHKSNPIIIENEEFELMEDPSMAGSSSGARDPVDIHALLKNNKIIRFEHDFNMLQQFEQWDKLEFKDKELALSEHVGKTLAYNGLKKGMLFALPDKNNKPHFYSVEHQFNNNGVIPALLVPLNENQKAYNTPPTQKDVHLIFRGTNSLNQWFRNVDFRGVGKTAFNDSKKLILNMVMEYLRESNAKDITLHISGHSLGGCDTKRAFALLMDEIANSDENSPLRAIRKINVTTHNAPSPEPEVNQLLKTALAKIVERKIPIENIDLIHIRYFDKSREDIVSKLGEITVGADETGKHVTVNDQIQTHIFRDTPFFRRTLIEIKIDEDYGLSVEGIMARHSFKAFNTILRGQTKWAIENLLCDRNSDESKEIEKKLAGYYHWDDTNARLLDHAKWHGGYTISPVKNSFHFLFNYLLGAVVKPRSFVYPDQEYAVENG